MQRWIFTSFIDLPTTLYNRKHPQTLRVVETTQHHPSTTVLSHTVKKCRKYNILLLVSLVFLESELQNYDM